MMKFVGKIEDIFCAVSLLLTTLVLFVNVVLRYAFSSSTSWAEELIRYLMIWVTFIGGAVCVRRGAHIRMDFVMTMLPEGAARLLTRFVYLIAAGFCAALLVYSVRLVRFTVELEQTSPAMGVPMWVPYLAMPLGSALMTTHFLVAVFAKEGAE